MKRWLYVSETITGAPEAVAKHVTSQARASLQGDTAGPVHADGSFPVPGDPSAASGVTPTLRTTLGVATRRADGRLVLPVQWRAEHVEAAFPKFDGALEVEPLSTAAARLSIVGSYVPPLGPVGSAIDATLLRGVAERTATVMLRRLTAGIDHPAPAPSTRPRQLTVADVMTTDPLVLDVDLPVRTAALLLFHSHISGAPVVGGDGALIGVLTERDLLDKEATASGFGRGATEARRRREARTVGEACTRPAMTTAPDVPLSAAVGDMLGHDIARLVVIAKGRIKGIVTRHDVLAALLRTDAELLRAVEATLSEEPGVVAAVEWGQVELTGTISVRTRINGTIRGVQNIDGVMGVDAEDLRWDVDDVLPTVFV